MEGKLPVVKLAKPWSAHNPHEKNRTDTRNPHHHGGPCNTAPAQITFTANNGTIAFTGFAGPGGDVAIPDTTVPQTRLQFQPPV